MLHIRTAYIELIVSSVRTAGVLGRGFLLEDLQRVLEARNLRLAALLALLVRLGLRNALGLQLLPVLVDRVELLLGPADVLLQALKEGLGLLLVLRLVLDLRLLRLRRDLVLGRLLLVDLDRLILGRLALREQLREVGFNDLEHADDTRSSAAFLGILGLGLGMHPGMRLRAGLEQGLLLLGVVVTQHLQCHADALETRREVGFRGFPRSLLFGPDLVGGLLLLRDLGELLKRSSGSSPSSFLR